MIYIAGLSIFIAVLIMRDGINLYHTSRSSEITLLRGREWTEGIRPEENFWDAWLGSNGGQHAVDFKTRTQPMREIRQDFIDYFPKDSLTVRILDCGAGPLTVLGNQARGYDVEIIPADPLAPIYDKLLKRHGLTPYPRTQYCPIEMIDRCFAQDYFDISHIQNALDHSENPLLGIINMLMVTRPGGLVYLWHERNEAENEKYVGFHQWNFDVDEQGSFIIKDARNNRTNVNDAIAQYAQSIKNKVIDNGLYVYVETWIIKRDG